MKLLNNEFEYREWMHKVYLHLDEEFPSVFGPDELEREILRQAPKEFPCLVQLVGGESAYSLQSVQFIYRSQIEEWAKLFGIIS
ncbi:hypothetical protein [Rahnella variigena]|uniref:hypothetical protein n=1 Tax=Rahnella variigena TaxID=574964 RepID=UPI0028DBB4A3|nr:hypothetical protein [Rahnella variigena]